MTDATAMTWAPYELDALRAVAAKHHIPPEYILGRCRREYIVTARFEFWSTISAMGTSRRRISMLLKVDRSSVGYGIRTFANRAKPVAPDLPSGVLLRCAEPVADDTVWTEIAEVAS